MIKKVYLLNAFSLNMLPIPRYGRFYHLYVRKLTPEEAYKKINKIKKEGGEIESAIGHPSTAKLLSKILHMEVKPERKKIMLNVDEDKVYALVILISERLPEGKTLEYNEILELFAGGKVKLVWLEILPYYVP